MRQLQEKKKPQEICYCTSVSAIIDIVFCYSKGTLMVLLASIAKESLHSNYYLFALT